MTDQQNQTVAAFFKSIEQYDADALRALVSPDATISTPHTVLHGQDGAEQLVKDLSRQYVSWVAQPLRTVAQDGTAAVEWTCTVTDFGGSQGRVDGCCVFDFENDKIHRLRVYWRPEDLNS